MIFCQGNVREFWTDSVITSFWMAKLNGAAEGPAWGASPFKFTVQKLVICTPVQVGIFHTYSWNKTEKQFPVINLFIQFNITQPPPQCN